MSIEEENVALKAQIAELSAKAGKATELESTVSLMKKNMDELQLGQKKKDLEYAKKDALTIYENLKAIKEVDKFLDGSTPEEITLKAKSLSESIALSMQAKEDELKKLHQSQWANLPGSVPSSIALSKDRQDEYESARKITNTKQRITTLMAMHINDLGSKTRGALRAALGV